MPFNQQIPYPNYYNYGYSFPQNLQNFNNYNSNKFQTKNNNSNSNYNQWSNQKTNNLNYSQQVPINQNNQEIDSILDILDKTNINSSNNKNNLNNNIQTPQNSSHNINSDLLYSIIGKTNQDLEQFIESKNGALTIKTIIEGIYSSNIGFDRNTNIPFPIITDFLKRLLQSNLKLVILNKYGSFFFESFIKLISADQCYEILESPNISNSFAELCCGKHSNIVIQQIILKLQGSIYEKNIQKLMEKDLDSLSRDQCANFVLNQILNIFSFSSKLFIFNYIENNLVKYSTESQYGHYLTKNFIKYVSDEISRIENSLKNQLELSKNKEDNESNFKKLKQLQTNFIKKVIENFHYLSGNKYGHFVLIDALEMWGTMTCKDIIQILLKNVDKLSKVIYGYAIFKRIFIVYSTKQVRFYFIIFFLFKLGFYYLFFK